MSRAEDRVYQLHLEEQLPEVVYQFNRGTIIFPLRGRRGVLQGPVTAERTKKKKWGLTVYRSLCPIDLYLSGHFWTLPEGSFFAAYSNYRHKMNII